MLLPSLVSGIPRLHYLLVDDWYAPIAREPGHLDHPTFAQARALLKAGGPSVRPHTYFQVRDGSSRNPHSIHELPFLSAWIIPIPTNATLELQAPAHCVRAHT